MVRILAIGDFHGKFPKKWERLVKKEKIDFVLSNGDYLPFHYRKIWFKHCFDKDVGLWEVIGKKKYKELVLKDLKMGEEPVRKLNSLPVPVFTTLGNIDYPKPDDLMDYKPKFRKYWKWADDYKIEIVNIMRKYKNVQRVDYTFRRCGEYVIIGGRGHSNSGRVKSKAYKKHRTILDKLFKKFSKELKAGKVIFLTHNVPYNTKLDKIGNKAHPSVRGKHFGSKMFRRLIDRYQPVLHVGGHIHEAKGKQKLGKTMCVNPGAIHDGEASIIDISDKGFVKVRFIK